VRNYKSPAFLTEILIIAFATAFIFFRLGNAPVCETTEARYAEVAREMLATGNFILPQENYLLHLTKPPFAYWSGALGMLLFGVNEFGVREGRLSAVLLLLFPLFFGILSLQFPDEQGQGYHYQSEDEPFKIVCGGCTRRSPSESPMVWGHSRKFKTEVHIHNRCLNAPDGTCGNIPDSNAEFLCIVRPQIRSRRGSFK